ncbi:MAG TPA: flagellar hook-basal body complex protein FliE [Polyangia bacterium]|jgi:flagellar hook-basal body complex protein FliE|nr:flagellar hook-basal body complex protein FliE [Polyangia bacterium]
MSIENIKTISPADLGGIDGIDGPRAPAGNLRGPDGASFAETLGKAFSAVESTQVAADDQAARVAMGGGNLHEMSLALEKADISLRLATKVRNKLLDAYNEIMRMGV